MFWNITADNWALLWSAVVGALVAGGSAAGVALWVLRRTREDQAELAKTQLDEQRVDLERQLEEQRAGLELQLHVQRREASKARETAAIADLLAAVAQLESNCTAGEIADIEKLHLAFESAMIRWEMELDHEGMADEIQNWHFLTRKLVRMTQWENELSQGTTFRDALWTASHGLAVALKRWPKAHGQTRDEIVAVIKADRELAMDPIDKDIARSEAQQSTPSNS